MTNIKKYFLEMYHLATNTQNVLEISEKLIFFIIKLVLAFIVFKIIKKIMRALIKKYEKINNKINTNKSLRSFTISTINIIATFIAFMVALLIIGVRETAFIGLLGGAGLGIGLALKDTLSNFTGGIILILFKAYEIDDFVEVDGVSGTVCEINVFATVLNTIENQRILVPNGLISTSTIINYSKNKMRRLNLLFGISYNDDFKKALKILTEIADNHPKISQKIEKVIRLKELADSSINIVFRAWCSSADYWDVYYDVLETVKIKFDENNINIPYPQLDIHLVKKND